MLVPVKINLGLNVLRKRGDGFHDLETLFVPCTAFSDELCLTPIPGSDATIEIIGEQVDWDPQQDLTKRAWRLLKESFPSMPAVHIRLEKHSPVGAGLGGGSADAAYVLRTLNEMFCLGLPRESLAAFAARLGSDCAFFIYDGPMIGEGRGEVLTPYPLDLSGWELRVEVPEGISVSTKEAYVGVLAAKEASGRAGMPLREALGRPLEEWKECLVNDFEATVFPLHPEIASLKERMYRDGAVYASMSGSGSSVFGLFAKTEIQ